MQPEIKEGDGPIALVCAPTRELCQQVRLRGREKGRGRGKRSGKRRRRGEEKDRKEERVKERK